MKSFKGWKVLAAVLVLPLIPSLAAAQQWNWPDEPENLQVLPEDWSGQRLRPVMTGFSRALGVRCSHCHVGEEGQPLSTFDFASDENPNKDRARAMLRMLGDINEALKAIEPSGPEPVNMWCHTCHRGRPRPLTLADELEEVYRAEGSDEAIHRYAELREGFYGRGSYDFGENSLNAFGYVLLADGELDGAVRVFELNVELFPASSNVYDSLGEAHMNRGDTELAIRNYQRSLELDPDNDNAVEQLKKLVPEAGT